MPLPVVAGLGAIGVLLALKEVADFVQIGLVAWQTGKRFQQNRSVTGGSVGIDGQLVTVMLDSFSVRLPIEDAAAKAGVTGVNPRGPKPATSGPPWRMAAPGERVGLYGLSREASTLREYTLSRPAPGQDRESAASSPAGSQKPFTLREFLVMQQEGIKKATVAKTLREAQAAALEREHEIRLAAVDVAIAREKIAAEKDTARLQVVAQLQRQREDLAAQFARQERDLATKLNLAREQQEFERGQQERRFAWQLQLQDAEQRWKSVEAAADRTYKERVQREAAEWGQYYKNLNADLALTRAVDAASKISDVVQRYAKGAATIVEFASVFGR